MLKDKIVEYYEFIIFKKMWSHFKNVKDQNKHTLNQPFFIPFHSNEFANSSNSCFKSNYEFINSTKLQRTLQTTFASFVNSY
jgi:hypothetical protein